MPIRLEKSGELTMLHGGTDAEPGILDKTNTRCIKLAVFLVVLAAVTAAMWIALDVPGHEALSHAVDVALAAMCS